MMATATATDTAAAETLFGLLPPIFRRCVFRDVSVTFDATTPFVAGDWCYATDGRAIVRVPATAEVRAAAAGVPRDKPTLSADRIGEVWGHDDWFDRDPSPVPALAGLPACNDCRGSGRSWCECCDQPCDCGGCDGTGVRFDVRIQVAPGVDIGPRYARLLADHGATLYLPVEPRGEKAIRFTTPGGVEGRVMPLKTNPEPRPCPTT